MLVKNSRAESASGWRMLNSMQDMGSRQRAREIVLQERERKNLSINALKANDDRQRLLDQYIALDPPVPDAEFDLIMWTFSVFSSCTASLLLFSTTSGSARSVICDNHVHPWCPPVFFMVAESKFLRQFLQAVRPSFEKRMPPQMRKYLSNTSLSQVYASTEDVAEAKLKEHPGKCITEMDARSPPSASSSQT
jgi:hypothetical protein